MANGEAGTKRRTLSRSSVVSAAIALADGAGINSLSMRKLADRLEVEAMSLYHHVSNKQDLLDGMIDAVFSEIELPPPGVGWKEGMRVRAVSARTVLVRHPWATPFMDSRTAPGPATLKHHDAVLRCLRRAGFTIELAAHAFSLIDAYLYGFALQEKALPFDSPEELERLAEDMLNRFSDGRYPYLEELTTQHALQPGYSYSAEFEFGLDLILDGLEHARSNQAGQ